MASKKLISLAIFFTLVFSTLSQAALQTNTNFAIRPESVRCINVEIPDDFGAINTRKDFTLLTDCDDWCGLTRAQVTASPINQIILPLCISTFGKPIGSSKKFSVLLEAGGETRTFNYGICVSEQEDIDTGKGEPCKVVNNNQKIFDISFSPQTLYGVEGEDLEYTAYLYSEAVLDIELQASTGTRWPTVKTMPSERIPVKGTVKVGEVSELTVEAFAQGCELDSCNKSATLKIISQQKPQEAVPVANFSIQLTPDKVNVQESKPVKFTLDIINFGEEKSYTVELILPQTVLSDFISTSRTVADRDIVSFGITPQAKGLHEVTVKVTNDAGQQKLATAYLTLDEVGSDIERITATTTDTETIRAYADLERSLQDKSYEEAIKGLSDLKKQEADNTPNTGRQPQPKQTTAPSGDNLPIYMAVVVVIAGLILVFLKKRKVVDEEAEEELDFEDEEER